MFLLSYSLPSANCQVEDKRAFQSLGDFLRHLDNENIYHIGIYVITSPSNKKYVGKTTKLKMRMNDYKSQRCKGQVALYRAIKKYKWEDFIIEFYPCDEEKLNENEVLLISLLNTRNKKFGYNLREGGIGGRHSLESIELMKRKLGEKPANWKGGKNGLCPHCNVNKRGVNKRGIANSFCKDCNKKYLREYMRDYYYKNVIRS